MTDETKNEVASESRPVKGAWWTLTVLALVAFIDFADRGLMGVALESIKEEFDLSDTQLGLLGGTAFIILRAALLIPLGRLADVWNRKALVVICMSGISAMTLLFGFAKNFATILAARFALGGATAGTTPASVSMVADMFPTKVRGFAMGIWNLGSAVGAAVGFTVAGWITFNYGWRTMMISFGIVSFVIALIMLVGVREPARRDSTGNELAADDVPPVGDAFRFMLSQKTLLHIAIAFGLVYGIDVIAWIWEAPFLQRSFDMDIARASTILGSAWLVGARDPHAFDIGMPYRITRLPGDSLAVEQFQYLSAGARHCVSPR